MLSTRTPLRVRLATARLVGRRCLVGRRHCSSRAAFAETETERPTAGQLKRHFIASALPMVGFGFMDNTVMIQAGNAIDCTLGVSFGLSTLTAAPRLARTSHTEHDVCVEALR